MVYNNIKPIDKICSFDIETNQYYDYSGWVNSPAESNILNNDFERKVYKWIKKRAPEYLKDVPEDYCAGRNIATELLEEFKSLFPEEKSARREEFDAGVMAFDGCLDYSELKVVPSKCEMYLACSVETPWTINGTDWYNMSIKDWKNTVKSAPATFLRNLDEADKYFTDLYENAIVRDRSGRVIDVKPVMVVIHNLSYEFNQCLKHLPIFKRIVSENKLSMLTNNSADTVKCMQWLIDTEGDKAEYLSTCPKLKLDDGYTVLMDPVTGQPAIHNNTAIYIVDTWKLTGKSISKLGKGHDYKKLDYDYGEIRTNLVQEDYDYNRRDCEIALLGLYEAYAQAITELDEKYKTTGTAPISANNIVSTITKSKFSKEFRDQKASLAPSRPYKNKHKGMTKPGACYMTEEQYADYKPTTGGGLVFVNPDTAFTRFVKGHRYKWRTAEFTVNEICHPDLNSAHPSQVYKRLFPVKSPKLYDTTVGSEDYLDLKSIICYAIRDINRMTTPDYISKESGVFDTLLPRLSRKGVPLSGYATFTIKGLRCKKFYCGSYDYILPSLWSSKAVNKKSGTDEYDDVTTSFSKDANIYSGKYIEASEVTVKLTFEDFISVVGLFYEYDSFEMTGIHLYAMGPVSPYIRSSVDYLGKKKVDYKIINGAEEISAETGKPYFDVLDDCMNRTSTITETDKNALAEFKNNNDVEGCISFIATCYSSVKQQFNGIFGTNYQSLYRDADTITATVLSKVTEEEAYYSNTIQPVVLRSGNPDKDADMEAQGFLVVDSYDDAPDEVKDLVARTLSGELDTLNWESKEPKYDEDNKSGVNVLQGSYIAQWSRVDIALYTALIAKSGGIPMYIATDSCYYLDTDLTDKRLTGLIKGDGKKDLPYNGQTEWLKKHGQNINKLGGMSFEQSPVSIGYTQSLKILCELEDNKTNSTYMKVTFSGTSADLFFEDCNTPEEHFVRFFQPNGYVSAWETKAKSRKVIGKDDDLGCQELVGVGFINNRTGVDMLSIGKATDGYRFNRPHEI